MFFTSYEFIFVLLPVMLAGFFILQKAGWNNLSQVWLAMCSLVFYASLDLQHLPHLLVIIAVNYGLSWAICRQRSSNKSLAHGLMWLGVSINILMLLALKYLVFWVSTSQDVAIPLGISFYTILQIAYLVAVFNDEEMKTPPMFHRYLLFVAFFPYVVAGPVVNKSEVWDQFEKMSADKAKQMLLPGLTLFAIGLFKKIVFADNLGMHVDAVYMVAEQGSALSMQDAWSASAMYALQIYFDFSAYSDMATGLAGMFGIQLARNFHSPLKADSLMEFWRRWHMSATRFFTNHFYLPLVMKFMRAAVKWRLSGTSRFLFTVLIPMLITFFLIGVWHGAGWTAALFGVVMGVAISINHIWIKFNLPKLPVGTGWLLTMLVVIVSMVLSRSETMDIANKFYFAMVGFGDQSKAILDMPTVCSWLVAVWLLVKFAPNSNEIMEQHPLVLPENWPAMPTWQQRFQWRYGTMGIAVTAVLLCISIVLIPKAAQFIYYRF